MRECRTYGSVRGVGGNAHPYRDSLARLEHSVISMGAIIADAPDAGIRRCDQGMRAPTSQTEPEPNQGSAGRKNAAPFPFSFPGMFLPAGGYWPLLTPCGPF